MAGKTVVRFGVYSAAAQTGLTDGSKVGVREEPGPIPRGLEHFLVWFCSCDSGAVERGLDCSQGPVG